MQICSGLDHCRLIKRIGKLGGSPGLVVMGRDSRSKDRGFESRHRILDGHFFTYICCKKCNVCLKRPKINEKEAGVGTFKKNIGKFSNLQPSIAGYSRFAV